VPTSIDDDRPVVGATMPGSPTMPMSWRTPPDRFPGLVLRKSEPDRDADGKIGDGTVWSAIDGS